MSQLTPLLDAVAKGDQQATEQLLGLVYDTLRRMARSRMAGENSEHTLQATALVHEAWLRMMGGGESQFAGSAHFFSSAAETMRRILVESARRRQTLKRGGDAARIELDENLILPTEPADHLLAVSEAIEALQAEDPEAAELVKMRYLLGLNMEDAAVAMGLSLRATERLWTFAKAWLRRRLTPAGQPPETLEGGSGPLPAAGT